MGKVNLLIENIFVVIRSLIFVASILFLPITAIAFGTSDRDVLWLETKKCDIELRLESELPAVRAVAISDANRYNNNVSTLQKSKKKVFVGIFISDAIDALELIEL